VYRTEEVTYAVCSDKAFLGVFKSIEHKIICSCFTLCDMNYIFCLKELPGIIAKDLGGPLGKVGPLPWAVFFSSNNTLTLPEF
jgi:hypothetical protein